MNYDIGDIMKTISDHDKRLRQLEVSPRGGAFKLASAHAPEASFLETSTNGVWSIFELGGDYVTVETGRRALVMWTCRPIVESTFMFVRMDISYFVTGATTVMPGAFYFGQFVPYATQTGDLVKGPDFLGGSQTMFHVIDGLNPGENNFVLAGRYLEQRTSSDPLPYAENRSILVVPLDV